MSKRSYERLTSVVEHVDKKDDLLLLGDFNTQMGNDNSDLECVMGKHNLGSTLLGENHTDPTRKAHVVFF